MGLGFRGFGSGLVYEFRGLAASRFQGLLASEDVLLSFPSSPSITKRAKTALLGGLDVFRVFRA